ncbi:MAG: hypothetical protein ACK583_07535 [Cyanobacteriota bacterium]
MMMPTYDGADFYIPPYHNVILVPCNSDDPEHRNPSMDSCLLLTRTGVKKTENTLLMYVYTIDNDTNVGLLLKHGDLIGAYYTGPHGHIKAERSQMLTSEYKKLLRKQSSEAIGDEDYYPSPCLPLLDSIAEEVLTLDGLSIN